MSLGTLAFADLLAAAARRTEAALDRLLPRPAGPEDPVPAAMRHAALGGGKRLRAVLVLEGAALLGAAADRAERAAAALEMLHAYSLVHDDLPCMDDDDLRRGRPTVHVKWDEATAVLAGDALQALAFEVLADPATHPEGAVRAALCLDLARAAGHAGMVGGQALDLAAERAATPPDLAAVTRLQALKTGALIRCAARAGALLAGAGPAETGALDRYGAALGLAFQIRDDILDETGDAALAGKRLRKDRAAGKATFVGLLGLDGAARKASTLIDTALAEVDRFGARAEGLRGLARFVLTRAA